MSNLKAIRKAAGFSQIRLADRANISRFRLSLAESGLLDLRGDELQAIRTAITPEIQKTARLASEFESAGVAVAIPVGRQAMASTR